MGGISEAQRKVLWHRAQCEVLAALPGWSVKAVEEFDGGSQLAIGIASSDGRRLAARAPLNPVRPGPAYIAIIADLKAQARG
jgi:hypothetical protein